MFILDASGSFGLVWMAGEDGLIVLMVCFSSKDIFVIVHSDSCSLRKSGPFCYLPFMLIRLFYFILLINQLRSIPFQYSTSLSYCFPLGPLLPALRRRY